MKSPYLPIFLLVISLLALFASCGDDGTGPEQRVLTSLASIAGDAQIDTVAQQLPAAIQVQALDQNDKPMEGVAVNFVVTSGGGEPFGPYSVTDAAGMAYQFWTLGELAGPHTMEARAVAGGKPLALEFSATAVPDRVAWIELSADSVVASRGNIVYMDEVAEFSAQAFDRFENLNARTGFEWSVSDPRLAAISASGVLSPRDTGLVVVAAGKDGITEHDTLWIQPTGSPGCLAFDFERLPDETESGDFVEVPDATSLDVITHWTIEAWINPSSENFEVLEDFRHIISKWNGAGNASYVVQLHGQQASVAVHDGSSTRRTESEPIIQAGSWYHLAAAFSNGLVELYVNGVLVASDQIDTVPMDSDRPVVFGREGPPWGRYYAGLIDEVRIWNVYRSQSEIIGTMTTSLAGTESGLVGYWRFDEGSGDTAFDATTNANHGRLGDSVGVDASDPQWRVRGAPINN